MSIPKDGNVEVQPNSTGAVIDTSQLVRSDGKTAERQRAVLADGYDALGLAAVRNNELAMQDADVRELLLNMVLLLERIASKLGC